MNRLFALVLSLALMAGASAQALVPPEVAAKSFLVLDLTSNRRSPSARPTRRPTRRR